MQDFTLLKTNEARRKQILLEQDGRCNHCGISDWRGKPLPLELEHIDGHSSNNDRANLECICPNCHSQTDTWRGRNKGKGRRIAEETYVEALRECKSIHKALLKLGLAPKGGNYRRAKELAERYSIQLLQPTGHFCAHAKLSAEQVVEIRALEGLKPHHAIGATYGVSRTTIRSILRGDTYRDC